MKLSEFLEGAWEDEQKRPQQNKYSLYDVYRMAELRLMLEIVWQQFTYLPLLLSELVSRLTESDGEARQRACAAFRSAINNLPPYINALLQIPGLYTSAVAHLQRIYDEVCQSQE